MRGLGLGLGLSRGGAGLVTAKQILSAAAVWADLTDLTSMKQEITGASATTAAAANFPVGSVKNKGSKGGWITAASDSGRPSARAGYVEYDGSDDDLNATIGIIGSACEFMVATSDGCYFQAGARYAHATSFLRLPCSATLKGYAIKSGTWSAAQKKLIAAYYGHASYVDAAWIMSTRTRAGTNLSIVTASGATWSAYWSGGSLTGQTSGTSAVVLSASNIAGLVVITTTSTITATTSSTNSWSYSVSDMPASITSMGAGGANTIIGYSGDFPASLATISMFGFVNIFGDVSALPSTLTYFRLGGVSTIGGSFGSLPVGVTYILVTGNNTITFSGSTWYRSSMDQVRWGLNKTSAEVDAVLIALAATVTTWNGVKVVDLQEYGNGAPTSASAAAIVTLQNRTVNVSTN